MQIYYFLYLCPEQTIILAMEIENQSVDYRPLILVAEDDDSNFKLIKAIIGKKCEVQWARNGEEIGSLFLENRDKADAILMDIKMPVMNGYDAARKIRASAHPEAGTIPVAAMTANTFAEDVRNALDAGMDGHLAKPIDMPTVRRVVGEMISRRRKKGR